MIRFSLLLTILVCVFVTSDTFCQQWKQYYDSGKYYIDSFRFEKGIEFYAKAGESIRKDSSHTKTYALICDTLARAYLHNGQFTESEHFYLEAKNIKEKLFGKESQAYASSCINLGELYGEWNKIDKIKPLIIQGHEIMARAVGKKHADYATSCHWLSALYIGSDEEEKTINLCLEALQIRENLFGKMSPEYAQSLDQLGASYTLRYHFKKGETLKLLAKEIMEKISATENVVYADICRSLAWIYQCYGNYSKSESLYLLSLQVLARIRGKTSINYARANYYLGIFYRKTGSYEKAEAIFLQIRLVVKKVVGKDSFEYADMGGELGMLYTSLGQYQKAEPLLLGWYRKLEGVSKDYLDYPSWFLGEYYLAVGQFKMAEASLLQARRLGKKHGSLDFYLTISSRLAVLYRYLGKDDMAKRIMEELAQKLVKEAFGESKGWAEETMTSLFILTNLYIDMGRYEKAENLLLRAKQKIENLFGKENPQYIETCNIIGRLYWNLHQPKKANKFYQEAVQLQNAKINKVFEFTSEAEKLAFLDKSNGLESQFITFNTTFKPSWYQGNIYDAALFNRNLVLSSTRKLRKSIYQATDTSAINKYNNWINLRERLATWYLHPSIDSSLQSETRELETRANTLEKELTQLSETFKNRDVANATSWKDIQQHLKQNEAAIEFKSFRFFNGRRFTDSVYYLALLLKSNDSIPTVIRLFEEHQLEKLMSNGKSSGAIANFYQNDIKRNSCFNLLWKPIENSLKGITKIYFASAGLINRISLDALPLNEQQVLSDKYQLVQLSTTASLANESNSSINTADSIYLFGGIRYEVDSSTLKQSALIYNSQSFKSRFRSEEINRGNSWEYLPGTENEVKEIEKLGQGSHRYVQHLGGVSATEESLKSLVGKTSPAILHIATHGFFFTDPKVKKKESFSNAIYSGDQFKRSENPLLRSGLLFAGANNAWKGHPVSEIEDGILTAYEVSNLYLANTKLVVLSACETGLGEIRGNEGVYGLQRAFKIAGVDYLMMSLWKVPDIETSEFMQLFYKNIFAEQSIQDAFYQAQMEMKIKYRNQPFKWAAWILIH